MKRWIYFIFFLICIIINATITSIARTRKIPKFIPVLKIPVIKLHELTINDRSTKVNIELILEFFIGRDFDDG